jgi:hypothetical protein
MSVMKQKRCGENKEFDKLWTGYGLDGRGVGFQTPGGAEFCSRHVVQTGSGAHPISFLSSGYLRRFPQGKPAEA